MIKMHHASLLLSALFLSACASQPKEEVFAPAPAAVEQPAVAAAAPTSVAEQAAAPVATTAAISPAPKPAVKKTRKAKKKIAKTAPAVEDAPVAEAAPTPAPAPIVKEEIVVQEPTPAPVVAAPTPVAEEGFLKKYWMWLLGLVIAVIGLSFFVKKKD